jgi:uncharacterized protein
LCLKKCKWNARIPLIFEKKWNRILQSAWISKYLIKDYNLFRLLYSEIDAGEAEAIVLALEQRADLLLLDDQEARNKARRLNLPITGTVGVLLKAKNEGLISSLDGEIQRLQASGFWLSSVLSMPCFLPVQTSLEI